MSAPQTQDRANGQLYGSCAACTARSGRRVKRLVLCNVTRNTAGHPGPARFPDSINGNAKCSQRTGIWAQCTAARGHGLWPPPEEQAAGRNCQAVSVMSPLQGAGSGEVDPFAPPPRGQRPSLAKMSLETPVATPTHSLLPPALLSVSFCRHPSV